MVAFFQTEQNKTGPISFFAVLNENRSVPPHDLYLISIICTFQDCYFMSLYICMYCFMFLNDSVCMKDDDSVMRALY